MHLQNHVKLMRKWCFMPDLTMLNQCCSWAVLIVLSDNVTTGTKGACNEPGVSPSIPGTWNKKFSLSRVGRVRIRGSCINDQSCTAGHSNAKYSNL